MQDEDSLIARYFAPLAGPGGLGLLDDAACLAPPDGRDLVVTADALVGGIHFFTEDPPDSIARKALAVNLSDLAAKGAEPLGFVLALALAAGWRPDWLDTFAAGLDQEARAGACPLLGGDTVRTPGPLTLSITAFGTVPRGRMVRRTGARAGDLLFVSGTIGDAALGLKLRLGEVRPDSLNRIAWGDPRNPASLPGGIEQGCVGEPTQPCLGQVARDHLLDRYLHPRPRLALRAALLAHAHGAMDVSDGLVGDLAKMMRASGTGAAVDLARVPLSDAARHLSEADPDLFDVAVTGGDDYEILAAVPPAAAGAFVRDAQAAGVAVAAIGTVEAGGQPVLFRDRQGVGRAFTKSSFSHF